MLFAVFVFAASFSFGGGDGFESEADMVKKADKLFEQKQYAQALDYYSQLVSLHAQDANYNYKYGTCLLFASPDKEEALRFLKFAVSKPGVDDMAYYYVARAYHLNYYFKEAIKAYKDFKVKAKPKTVQENDVSLFIKQCEEGKVMIQDIQSIHVLSKKDISRQEFFRAYQLNEFDRKILVKTDEFRTKLDKKNKEYSLIVHNPALSEVYFSSYGEKGENGRDLFKMVHFADGTWSQPMTLGPLINTSLDEDYPYLHPNGRILYFASQGHNSIGGYDIFKSELDTETNLWKEPVNLGFAVNSPDDDILYITDMNENVAYFASSRANTKDEITVYKIIPNKEHQDNTVIKGEIAIENTKQKGATITVTDMETGIVVGVFKSNEKTGAYSMTLPSGKQYSFKVAATGLNTMEEIVSVPEKKEALVINQKISLKITPQEQMLVDNQRQVVVDDIAFNQAYKKSADLDVNSDKDIAFNTQPVKEKIEEEPLAKHDPKTESPKGEVKIETSNGAFVEEAFKDARELEKEYNALQDDAEAAAYVANIKKEEAAAEKKELIDLSQKLTQAATPEEKQKIQQEIDQKGKVLRKKTREAAITTHYAEAKKEEAKNKKEEYVAANQYAEIIKEATDAKNTDQAIAKLEQQKQKLDEIQERNRAADQISIEEAYTKTLVSRDSEQKAADAFVQEINADLKSLENEQKQLEQQLAATKNKELQQEFKLQIDELKQDLAKKNAERVIAEAELLAIKTDTDPIPDTKTIQGLQQQVNTVKAQDPSERKAEEKKKAEEEVLKNLVASQQKDQAQSKDTATKTIAVNQGNTLINSNKQKSAEQYNSEMLKAQTAMEQLVKLEEEKKALENAMAAASKGEKKDMQKKIDVLIKEEEKKKLEVKDHLEIATNIKEKDKLNPEDIAVTNKLNEQQSAALENFSKTGTIATPVKEEVQIADKNTNLKTPIDTNVTTVKTPVDTISKNVVSVTNNFELKKDFQPEKATEDDVSLAALSAFGIKTDTSFAYGPSNTVKANLSNARTSENQALSLYLNAKAKQEAAAATDKKGDKKKLDKEAQDLQRQSQERQVQASENYFFANRAEYDYNAEIIKRAVADKKVQVPESKLTDIGNNWIAALVVREKVKSAKDFKEKVSFINEAYRRELELLRTQQAILAQIKDIKEMQQQVAASEKKIGGDTAAVKSSTDQIVNSTLPKTEQQLKQEKVHTLEEAYGVKKNSDYTYSKDVAVQNLIKEISALEDSAVTKYREAVALEVQAQTAKKSEAKKLKKQAVKLKRLGRIKEKEALAKQGELHEKEKEVNKEKIKQAFTKKKITISEKQKEDIKQVDEIFAESKKLREQAKKAKSATEQINLYNEAYAKEIQALEKQEAVLNGGTREELAAAEQKRLEEEKIAQEKQKELDRQKAEANKVIARQNAMDSLAQAKVAELQAQAEKEKNPKKKKELLAQSKEYELAADKGKNEALQKELKDDQLAYENKKSQSAELLKDKSPEQQKTIASMQNTADSLMKQATLSKARALSAADPLEARTAIVKANEQQNQALALQEKMKTVKDVPVETAKPADKNVAANNDTKKDQATGTDTPKDKTGTGDVAVNTAKKREEATKQYNQLLDEAKKTEKEIAAEVDKYTELKKEAKTYQQQSENTLAQAEGKVNEQEVQKLLNEAARLKKLADQKEEQALQSSQLIDNSRLEAQAKRKEAQLYMESLDPKVAQEVKKKAVDDNKKTDVFVDYKEKAQKEVVAAAKNTKPVDNNKGQQNNNNNNQTHSTINPDDKTIVKVDVEKAKIFGEKQSVEDAVLKDKFEISNTIVYSADKPIPIDAKLPEGLIYTVQVGAFKNPIPQDLFKGISPVNGEQTKLGFIRYTAGTFRSFKAASIARDKIRQMGYQDAFVVPFYNGQRISMEQAGQITEKASQPQQNALQAIEAREVDAINKVEVKNPVTANPQVTVNEAKSTAVNTAETFYTVQICVVSKPIAAGGPYDLQPLNVEKTPAGLYRYTTGKYKTFEEANARKAEINAAGIKDAFVTAYRGGQRISVADAQNGTVTITTNTGNPLTVTNTPSAAGIVFKVQIGAYRNEVPVETTTLFFKLPAKVEYYKDADGVTIFTVGEFTNPDDARKLKDQVIASGLKDAFMVAYQSKEKIAVDKALQLIKK